MPALFSNEPDIEIHAHSLGVTDEGAHIDILRPAFRAAELGRAGADLLREFGLREALLLPLIGASWRPMLRTLVSSSNA